MKSKLIRYSHSDTTTMAAGGDSTGGRAKKKPGAKKERMFACALVIMEMKEGTDSRNT